MTLKVTAQMHKLVERDDAPPGSALGLKVLETLIECMLTARPEQAGDLSYDVSQRPVLANSVIALAVGILTKVEMSFNNSAAIVEGLQAEVPETLVDLKNFVAQHMADQAK